jgi:hypothetical protein
MVVWRSRRVRHHKSNIEPWILATADKLLQTGSTGWDPYYGLNFVLESVSAVPDTPWSWDLDELWRTKQRYADQERRTRNKKLDYTG